MIFVTVGHKEFDRLIKKIDSISKDLGEEFVMQIGDRPSYFPKSAKYSRFILRKEIDDYFQKAELIISHCSIGVLLKARKHHKPLIMVPRQYIYREVVDDHQVGFAKMLIQRKNIQGVKFVFDIDQLNEKIEEILRDKEDFVMKASEDRSHLINTIYNFILNLRKHR